MQRVFNKLIVFTGVLVMILMSPFLLQSRQDEVLNSMGDYDILRKPVDKRLAALGSRS